MATNEKIGNLHAIYYSWSVDTVRDIMKILARLLENQLLRLKESISTSNEDKKTSSLSGHSTKSSRKSSAINTFKNNFKKYCSRLTTCGRFPYQEETVGNWCTHNILLPDKSAERTINILNLERRPGKIRQYPRIKETDCDFISGLQQDDYRILYHGTNHDSAKDIIENGIRLNKLDKKRRQDFSCGRGFYLTDNFEEPMNTGAADWAFHRFNKNQAILIFKIKNSEMENHQVESQRESPKIRKILDDDTELKDFIEKFRLRTKDENLTKRDLERELKNVSFVEGRCVQVVDNEIRSIIEGSNQICLHCEDLAECFNRYLDSAIFFDYQRR